MSITDFILRIAVATLVGAAVGFERQWSNKSAGLRTNTLVSLGACIFVIISFMTTEHSGDPSRIIGQIVSGMGFLGAGVIFRQGANVQGLTTAATLWCSAALGSLTALGAYTYAVICAALIILINLSFKFTDRWIISEQSKKKSKDSKREFFE